MSRLTRARRALIAVPDAYAGEQTDALFLTAMRENCRYQYEHCPGYRRMLDGMGFSPEALTDPDALARLPFLPTLLLKRHRLFSVPRRKMLIKATSSGTSGTASEVGFTLGDLLAMLNMVLRVSKLRHLFSVRPCHYVVLGYQPHRGNTMGAAKTAFGATMFTPALSRTYALVWRDGGYQLDLDGVIRAVERHSRSRFPLRFMGFPSYTWFLMQKMAEEGRCVQLPKGSKLMLGGGWKQFYAEQVDKAQFYALAKQVFGLADTDVVEFYGAVEHPILYCDCERHHFHVPIYSRVIIRDPTTLQPLERGKAGLVNLTTPLIQAVPLLSVMTDDLGVLHDGADCGCGLKTPYLEILGRVGLHEIKTCAAGAAEQLAEVRL